MMQIALFTNTYLPHVGGVARSVERLAQGLRERGHRVVIVAPTFEGQPANETDVVRIPAVQKFNGSDFSVVVPTPFFENMLPSGFAPDIAHAHHPYLLGDKASRFAATRNIPCVFTHHTLYEQYTHYVPVDSENLKRFVIELSTGFANRAAHVIAPSESIRDLLQERGVHSPISVVPTGLKPGDFRGGDRAAARARLGIPPDALVIGHVGRLAPEKNLDFLAHHVAAVLKHRENAWFLVVGTGPSTDSMRAILTVAGVADRVVFAGQHGGRDLADCLAAMDLFAFSSKSETQGMVLTEAMAAGLPVVALDASGAREVVETGKTGVLVMEESEFPNALEQVADRLAQSPGSYDAALAQTVEAFTVERSLDKHLAVYEQARQFAQTNGNPTEDDWDRLRHQLSHEWEIWSNRASALGAALAAEPVK